MLATVSFALYLCLGLVTGLLSGLFGIGGGVIIVPLLYWGFALLGFPGESLMVMAVATSLATIIPTSIASGLAHHRRGYVDRPFALKLAPAILLGAAAGANLVQVLPVTLFKLLVALFQVGVAITLLVPVATGSNQPVRRIGTGPMVVAGWLTGCLSALVGIGGGTLSIPFMLYCGLSPRHAVATASVCGFPIALMSSGVYLLTGWNQPGLPDWNLGYIHLPAWLGIALASVTTAPLGARLAHRLPVSSLKRWLGGMVGMAGTKLLMDTLLPE